MNGSPGRRAVERLLPGLREELDVDFCVVNGENAADGLGITPRLAEVILIRTEADSSVPSIGIVVTCVL